MCSFLFSYCYLVFYILPPHQIGCKLEKFNDVMIWHDVIVTFFWRCFISLVKFSYWSKFHVNIITSSGVMAILFYEGLPRNLEIGNTPVWVLPNIWRLERVRGTKFGKNGSNEMLLNAAKCQGQLQLLPPIPHTHAHAHAHAHTHNRERRLGLNKSFLCIWPNLSQKSITLLKQNKWTWASNPAHFNVSLDTKF